MAAPKPIRTWSPAPFAMGPKQNTRRRVAMGSLPASAPPTTARPPIVGRPAPAPLPVAQNTISASAPRVQEVAKIACVPGGPYLCYGVSVETANGGVRAQEGKPVALCACGRSVTRPFCDGSHSKPPTSENKPSD